MVLFLLKCLFVVVAVKDLFERGRPVFLRKIATAPRANFAVKMLPANLHADFNVAATAAATAKIAAYTQAVKTAAATAAAYGGNL
jgi:hypothetical protein